MIKGKADSPAAVTNDMQPSLLHVTGGHEQQILFMYNICQTPLVDSIKDMASLFHLKHCIYLKEFVIMTFYTCPLTH